MRDRAGHREPVAAYRPSKLFVRQQRLHLRVVELLADEFLKDIALLQAIAVLGEGRRIAPDHPAKARQTSDTGDCSRAAQSTAASECRRTLVGARHSAVAPAAPIAAPRWRKACPNCGLIHRVDRAQARVSCEADGSSAPAVPAKYSRTARPGLRICPASLA